MKKLSFFLIILSLFYLLSPTKENLTYAQENNEEPEIINPKQSIICTDFNIRTSEELPDQIEEQPLSSGQNSNVQGTNSETGWADGNISLSNLEHPDFFLMESRLKKVLINFLPKSLNDKLSITSPKLESKSMHFVISKSADLPPSSETTEENIPETKLTFPEWWGELLGETKVFCGIFNSCAPPEKLALIIEQPETSEFNEELIKEKNNPCEKTELVLGEKTEINDGPTRFSTWSIFSIIKNTFERIIDQIKQLITQTSRETELENKTRGYLVGGETLINQSSFFNSFIPSDINEKIKNLPLAENSQYEVDIEYGTVEIGEGAEKNNFQGQGETRMRYCLQLCSLYPLDFPITDVDPICPSCDPDDYLIN